MQYARKCRCAVVLLQLILCNYVYPGLPFTLRTISVNFHYVNTRAYADNVSGSSLSAPVTIYLIAISAHLWCMMQCSERHLYYQVQHSDNPVAVCVMVVSELSCGVGSHVTRTNISEITLRYRTNFPRWCCDVEMNWRKSCKSCLSTRIFTFGNAVWMSLQIMS